MPACNPSPGEVETIIPAEVLTSQCILYVGSSPARNPNSENKWKAPETWYLRLYPGPVGNCAHTFMYTSTHVQLHTCTYMPTYTQNAYIHTYIHACMYTYLHTVVLYLHKHNSWKNKNQYVF